MIIKLYDYNNEMWQLFDEVDSVSYRKIEGQVQPIPEAEDNANIIDFTFSADKPMNEEMAKNPKVVIDFMNKNQAEETRVFAYSPVYLMNNNGRTIETI